MASKSKLTAFEDLADATVALKINKFRRRQLHKKVLEQHAKWALVLFQAQDWKPEAGVWTEPFTLIQRYVRSGGKWRRHSHINLRGDQAMKSLQVVATWEAMAKDFKGRGIDIGDAVEQAEAGATPKRKARRREDAEPSGDPPAAAQPT